MGKSSLWCLILCCFLQLCSAQKISCTATQHADQTVYNISPEYLDNASDGYSWSAGTEVIAHHEGRNPDRVKTNTINTLVTFKCIDTIIFKRYSNKSGHDKASCAINCTQHSHLEQKVNGTLHPHVEKAIPHDRSHWIAAAAVLVAVTLVGLLGFLCCRKKERIPRKWRHVDDLVRMENGDQRAADVVTYHVAAADA